MYWWVHLSHWIGQMHSIFATNSISSEGAVDFWLLALQCWPVKLKSPLHPTAQSVPFHYENAFNPQRERAVPCRVRGTRLPSNRTHLCPIHATSKELPQNSLGSHLLMSPLPFIPTPFPPPPVSWNWMQGWLHNAASKEMAAQLFSLAETTLNYPFFCMYG